MLLRFLPPLILGGGILSCSGDTSTGPAPVATKDAYGSLQLNQHAINMALTPPANTIRLTATPFSLTGAPMSGLGSVQYTTADSTVTVDSTGLVTAHFTTPSTVTIVVATLQDPIHRVTHVDTAIIQVTDTIPQHALTLFSVQPASTDSAKRALDFGSSAQGGTGSFPWPAHAVDAGGTPVCGTMGCAIQVYYTSSNPSVATIDRTTGTVSPIDTGHVVFTATTWMYGVPVRDSVAFTIGYRLNYTVTMTLAILLGVLTLGFVAPKKLILGVGAVVTFCAPRTTKQVDIVFDHPEAADSASCIFGGSGRTLAPPSGSGNIAPFGGDTNNNFLDTINCASRRFKAPGTYRYHSSLFPSDTFEILIQKD